VTAVTTRSNGLFCCIREDRNLTCAGDWVTAARRMRRLHTRGGIPNLAPTMTVNATCEKAMGGSGGHLKQFEMKRFHLLHETLRTIGKLFQLVFCRS
jgi:hypothetical protein